MFRSRFMPEYPGAIRHCDEALMTFRIVKPGTPGAIPLMRAMEIRLRELGLTFHSKKTRQRLATTTKRSWEKGTFGPETAKKQSASMRRRYGESRGKRG